MNGRWFLKVVKIKQDFIYYTHYEIFKINSFFVKSATRLMFEWHELTALLKFDN